MDRDAIVYSTYEAGKRLNRLKAEFGLIDQKKAESIEKRIDQAVLLMRGIDQIMALPDVGDREGLLRSNLGGSLSLFNYSMSTVCGKRELEWPTRFYRMNFFKILKTLLCRRKPNVSRTSPTASS
jgi:hypothetical protein